MRPAVGRLAVFFLLLFAAGTAAAQPIGIPLTPAARREIVERVLSRVRPPTLVAGHRIAAVRVTVGSEALPSGATRMVATVVLFDHALGEARRVLLDTATGELLAEVRLPGRPQGSREEVAEATELVRRDPEMAALLDSGGVLDGGFIVRDPSGSRRRMMQLKLLSADRRSLLESIVVDLTRGALVSDAGPSVSEAPGHASASPSRKEGAGR